MTEKPIPEIEAMLEEYPGLLWHHCPDSRGCHGSRGLPDFLVVGPKGLIARECKPRGQHPRAGQVQWKYTLTANGLSWGLWTPPDVAGGLVRAELERLL